MGLTPKDVGLCAGAIQEKEGGIQVLAGLALLSQTLDPYLEWSGSAKANGREPKTCLGRVFNYKLGCFGDVLETHVCGYTPTSIVENSAQVSSC